LPEAAPLPPTDPAETDAIQSGRAPSLAGPARHSPADPSPPQPPAKARTTVEFLGVLIIVEYAVGIACGYFAYMKGIQKADAILWANWILVPLLLGLFAAREKAPLSRRARRLRILGLLAGPFLVIHGFLLAFDHRDASEAGWPFAAGSAVAGVLAMAIGARLLRRWPQRARVTRWIKRVYMALAVLLLGVLLVVPMEYAEVNALDHYGDGLLNLAENDCVMALFGKGLYYDGAECRALFVGGDLAVFVRIPDRDPSHRGPVLRALGIEGRRATRKKAD
jgi:hypothetical protein